MNILPDYVNKQKINAIMQENEKDILKRYANPKECGDDTPAHAQKTANLMGIMVDAFNKMVPNAFSENEKFSMMQAAKLHDIGKLGVPIAILNKNGRPTEEEFDAIKKHPQIGYDILQHIEKTLQSPQLSYDSEMVFKYAKQMSLNHHERIDGKGYPNGIKGDEIPMAAKMMAVVDVLEALTAVRAYKEPMEFEKAEKIIREGSGTQFDATLVSCLLDNEITRNQAKALLTPNLVRTEIEENPR